MPVNTVPNNKVDPPKDKNELETITEEPKKTELEICEKCNQPIGGLFFVNEQRRKKKKSPRKVENISFSFETSHLVFDDLFHNYISQKDNLNILLE